MLTASWRFEPSPYSFFSCVYFACNRLLLSVLRAFFMPFPQRHQRMRNDFPATEGSYGKADFQLRFSYFSFASSSVFTTRIVSPSHCFGGCLYANFSLYRKMGFSTSFQEA